MKEISSKSILSTIEKLTVIGDDAIERKDGKTYREIAERRTKLRVALGNLQKGRDPGDILDLLFDEDPPPPEEPEKLEQPEQEQDEDPIDMG